MPLQRVRAIFETDTFGVMAMTQAAIPGFRAQRSGVVVNVTSSAVLTPMPLVSVYTASKTAIEGFTGALAHELAAFGIRAKLVQPGYGPTTRFIQNSDAQIEDAILEPYMAFAEPILTAFATPALFTTEADVADGVWRAVHDEVGQLSFPAGPDAVALARALRRAAAVQMDPAPPQRLGIIASITYMRTINRLDRSWRKPTSPR